MTADPDRAGYFTFTMPAEDTVINAVFGTVINYPYTINSIENAADGVSVSLTKSADAESGTNIVIAAAYDSTTGALKDIGFGDVGISGGETAAVNVKLNFSDTDTVKAYVWNSLSGTEPLSAVKQK